MKKFRTLLAVPAAALTLALTGCAGITPQEYTPAPQQLARQHAHTVNVSVLAKDAGDAERTKAESAAMTTALSDAIVASKAFSGAERVKLVISTAVKKNYVEGLNRIAALQL